MSNNPDFSALQIEQVLYDTAEELGVEGKDKYFGYGKLNINKCIQAELPESSIRVLNIIDGSVIYDDYAIQTQYTEPENLYKIEIYIDNNKLTDYIPEKPSVYQDIIVDLKDFSSGFHQLKLIAYANEGVKKEKLISVNIQNKVTSGMRVKVTHNGSAVNNAYIQVYHLYKSWEVMDFDFVTSDVTSINGYLDIPNSILPSGNSYIITANYEVELEGR